jgi:hypothetical protein
MSTLLSVLLGVGLSAACGFRIFVPFLLVGIAARTGHVSLGSSFEWLATTPALVAPGMVMTASVVTGLDPMLKWTLALIAGGGIAGTVQALTVGTRKVSLLTTGGLGNPVVSTLELAGSVFLTVLAIALPLFAFAVIAWALFFGVRHLLRLMRRAGGATT